MNIEMLSLLSKTSVIQVVLLVFEQSPHMAFSLLFHFSCEIILFEHSLKHVFYKCIKNSNCGYLGFYYTGWTSQCENSKFKMLQCSKLLSIDVIQQFHNWSHVIDLSHNISTLKIFGIITFKLFLQDIYKPNNFLV